jgi:uncharacterized protein with FMN-binding domain
MKVTKTGFVTLLAGTTLLIAGCVNFKSIVITSPDLSKVADGAYRGNSRVGPVRVTVEVAMKDKAITGITIIRHFNGLGKKAEAIVPRIVEKQSLEVDVISGATASSKAILQAVERALQPQ